MDDDDDFQVPSSDDTESFVPGNRDSLEITRSLFPNSNNDAYVSIDNFVDTSRDSDDVSIETPFVCPYAYHSETEPMTGEACDTPYTQRSVSYSPASSTYSPPSPAYSAEFLDDDFATLTVTATHGTESPQRFDDYLAVLPDFSSNHCATGDDATVVKIEYCPAPSLQIGPTEPTMTYGPTQQPGPLLHDPSTLARSNWKMFLMMMTLL